MDSMCSIGKVCVDNWNSSPLCVCPECHLLNYEPVCGDDGITYATHCHMAAHACESGMKINLLEKKPCSKKF